MKLANFGGRPAPPSIDVKVNHKTGNFEQGSTVLGKNIEVIALGLIRQRQFWIDGERGRKLACESPEAAKGYAKAQYFPFTEAAFNPNNYPGGEVDGSIVNLPCDHCELRKWQDRTPPRCKEYWVLPIVMPAFSGSLADLHRLAAGGALPTIRFTGPPVRTLQAYMTPFRDNKTPTYKVHTRLSLTRVERNGNRFANLDVSESSLVDPVCYPVLSKMLADARARLTEPPATPTSSFSPLRMGN
jgi:hypothetical protein